MSNPPSPGLYIHVPFCRSKCPYCAFYSVPSLSLLDRWFEAIKREVLLYRGQFGRFDSIYVGGGTPSVLPAKYLESLMAHLFAHVDFEKELEITIEANPSDLSHDRITAIQAAGFNRVNLGVQSLDDSALSFLGRGHTAKMAVHGFERLRASGFENIGIDLIYGFRKQPLEAWLETLGQAVSLQAEHISCYQMTIEGRTVFSKRREKGDLFPLSDEEERIFFIETSQVLEAAGYMHYEVSNFARAAHLRSRHNRKYWDHTPYLGLGPSAHSFSGQTRWWNGRSIRKYCAALEAGGLPVEGSENLTQEQIRLETLALGLRTTDGVDMGVIPRTPEFLAMLERLRKEGLVRLERERVVPTREGFLVADALPGCFF